MAKKKGVHYVDNKVFLQAMIEWKEECTEQDEQIPVTNYIGECFFKIATHLSYRPNFINYTYRDEMISDGIENCLQYVANFDAEKSKNPFAYFTQIIYYAFLRRIQKEKKQSHVKHQLIEKSNIEFFSVMEGDDNSLQCKDFLPIHIYQKKMFISPRRKKVKSLKDWRNLWRLMSETCNNN